MADIFLIIVMIVAFLILVVMGVYLLVYYQHPDDHNDAYFPKFVVIGGFVLAGTTVLFFPLDVANREGYAGNVSILSGCFLFLLLLMMLFCWFDMIY
jgi:LMBR1 domain-containing protein 1